MNKEVKVVIGANYGDESKGLVSFCLAKKAIQQGRKVLTVFYNGGCQRAHTADGEIQHCVGAGYTVGSETHYDRMFMVDPIALWLDQAKVSMDPNCRLVLPCDVSNNQRRELEARKTGEDHGTCGMGIFEACKRSLDTKNALFASDIWSFISVYDRLINIEKKYGYPRDVVYNNENFMRGIEWIRKHCQICSLKESIRMNESDTIIFEGGQGLMLDQANKADFPYLTPSSPGLHNITIRLYMLGVVPELYYVSRSYLTRHGKGPLEGECKKEDINSQIEDRTNEPNPWQGELRYGFINPDTLHKRIRKDISEFNGIRAEKNIVFTHLNYTDGKLAVGPDEFMAIEKPKFIDHVYGSDKKDWMDVMV